MPTSSKRAQGKHVSTWARAVAMFLGAIVAIFAANALLCWVLEPYGTNTQIIWWDYRHSADKDIDTILTGSSYTMSGFEASVIDKHLGSSSFSLSSPSQALEDNFDTIQTAIEDHHVTRALLGIEYGSFTKTPAIQTASTIVQAQSQDQPLHQVILNYAKVMTRPYYFDTKASFECLFPWTFSHVDFTPEAIAKNVRSRIECPNPIEAGKRYMPGWVYEGQGYFELYGPMDFDEHANDYPPYEEGSQPFLEDRIEQMQRILDLCKRNNVQLYVIVMPQPAFNVLRFGAEYPRNMKALQQQVEAGGATFMDFNLALPPTYKSDQIDFSDNEHLDTTGARKFCPALASVIQASEQGADVNSLFYSYDQWDQWLASLDYISLCGCNSAIESDGVYLEAWALAGSDVIPEFQFSVIDGDKKRVVRPYDTNPAFVYPTEGSGSVKFYVEARQQGQGEPEHNCTLEVRY